MSFAVPRPVTTALGKFPNRRAEVKKLEPLIDEMNRDRMELQEYTKIIKKKLNIQSHVGTTRFDPNDEFNMSRHQLEMFWAFEVGGTIMLAERIYEVAGRYLRSGENAWKMFDTDEKRTRRHQMMPFVLHTIHPEVIRAVILRCLPAFANQPGHRGDIIRANAKLTSHPGTYLAQFGLKSWRDPNKDGGLTIKVNGQIIDVTGFGFSARVQKGIFDKCMTYLLGKDNQSALRIDLLYVTDSKQFAEARALNSSDRKYRGSQTDLHVQMASNVFDRGVWHKVEQSPDFATDAEVPLPYSSGYAGHSKDPSARNASHKSNKQASKILGLNNALVNLDHDNWEMYSHQIVRLCKDKHKDIAEATVSTMGSTYPEHGGYNGKRGGGLPSETTAPAFKYDLNCKETLGLDRGIRSPFAENLADNKSKTEKLQKWLELEQGPSCGELQEEYFEKVDEISSRYEKLEEDAEREDLYWVSKFMLEWLDACNEEERGELEESGIEQRYPDLMADK